MIQGLFPTPVGFYEFGQDFTPEEYLFLTNQETRLNEGNKTSVNSYVLNSPQLLRIKDFLKNSLSSYIGEIYGTNVQMDLKITQSWLNYSNKNNYHHTHSHSNSFISGVFYVQADKEQDNIIFYGNRYHQFTFSNLETTIWNAHKVIFPAITGQLILFPSSLVHGVGSITHDQTRISLSFNTFPFGDLGDAMNLTKLNITEVS